VITGSFQDGAFFLLITLLERNVVKWQHANVH